MNCQVILISYLFLFFPSYPIQEDHGLGTLQCRVEGNYIGLFEK